MQTLFQKTRAYKIVKEEQRRGVFHHAYLLLYPDPRNLKKALKVFAKLLFCCDEQNGEAESRLFRLIDEESFSDCLFFPEGGKKFMVEDAESIAEESALKPVEGKKKLFIIGDFSEATPAAQNKLLKLLEEPPEGVEFLLGATSAFSVFSTVLSRVKKLEVPPFSQEDVRDCLLRTYGRKNDATEYELCSAACGGILGTAENMLEGGAYKSLFNEALALCLSEPWEVPALVKKSGETKRKKELLSFLSLLFRDALFLKTAEREKNKSDVFTKNTLLTSERENLKKIAKKYSLSALIKAQEWIADAERQVAFNAVFPQCLELLIANIQKEK